MTYVIVLARHELDMGNKTSKQLDTMFCHGVKLTSWTVEYVVVLKWIRVFQEPFVFLNL